MANIRVWELARRGLDERLAVGQQIRVLVFWRRSWSFRSGCSLSDFYLFFFPSSFEFRVSFLLSLYLSPPSSQAGLGLEIRIADDDSRKKYGSATRV